MAIELQETQWAEQMIRSHSMGKKPSETLRRVARYYIDLGCSTGETRKKLEDFIQQCEPGASIPKWDRMLTFAVKRAEKNTAINIDRIVITDREMARIDALDGTQLRRLAFTLVCLAKYRQEVSKDFDGWVSTPDSAIMAMANVNTSIRRQSQLYRALREQGMIQFSRRVDNINVRVLFMEEGEPALSIDFTTINDYDLFLMMFAGLKEQDTKLVFGELDLTRFQMMVNQKNGMVVLRDEEKDITIDRAIHGQIAATLRKIHHIEKNRRKPANKEAKDYMMERARIKMKRNKNRKRDSQLESMIVALVNTEQFKYNFETVRDMTIYQFNESVRQVIKKIDYDNRMRGVYAGTISAKDLSQDDLNWMVHK